MFKGIYYTKTDSLVGVENSCLRFTNVKTKYFLKVIMIYKVL